MSNVGGMIDEMNLVAVQIADNCFRLSLADTTWQAFGFTRRPRRGLIWSLMTPAWKKTLEQRLLLELLLILSAAHLAAFVSTRHDMLRELVEFYWGDDGDRFGRLHKFSAKSECEAAINQYLATSPGDWHKLLLDHLEVFSVPDKKLFGRLLWGCVQFAMNVMNIKLRVEAYGADMASWPKPKTTEQAIRDDIAAIRSTLS